MALRRLLVPRNKWPSQVRGPFGSCGHIDGIIIRLLGGSLLRHLCPRMSRPTKLETVEAGRALAAIAVVLFHINSVGATAGIPRIPIFESLDHGVDFFFVISGFIIFHVHRTDIGRPMKAPHYLAKRAIRLYPMIFLVAGGWIALRIAAGMPVSAPISSLTLLPSLEEPTPIVIWTLRHEGLFYLAFLVLILNRRIGIALFCVWTAGSVAQLVLACFGKAFGGLPSFFFSSYQLQFMIGIGVAWLQPRSRTSVAPLMLGAVALIWLAGQPLVHRSGVLDYTSVEATIGVLALGVACGLVLYGLLCIEDLIIVPRWLLVVGAASYAIYLTHLPVIIVLKHLESRSLMFVGVLLVSLAVHFLFEKPISTRLRKMVVADS